jgi:hypothetical protein
VDKSKSLKLLNSPVHNVTSLQMLSENHTYDQKYEVKQEFSCWISKFFLHISITTNKGFFLLDFNYDVPDV